MNKEILFYGSGITGPSHLWMRRQFEFLLPYVHTVVEHQVPDLELEKTTKLILLPNRKKTALKSIQLVSDILTDLKQRQILKRAVSKRDIKKVIVHFLFNAVPHRKVWESVKKPVFVHCHGLDVTWEKTGSQRKWRKLWWGDYVEEVLKLSDNVVFVANSNFTKKKLTDIGIDDARVNVISPGVPVSENFLKRKKTKENLSILFIGRLVDVKGPLELIRAFELASSKGLNARLIIAGDGPLFKECKKMTANSDYSECITMTGAVSREEGERLRLEADIFSAHSCKGKVSKQEESFGVAFTEAMAAGLPVVTGRSGSLPVIIRHERDGFLFEPGDIESHAAYLLKLQNEPELRLQMGMSAHKRAREHFSIENEMKQLAILYGLHDET